MPFHSTETVALTVSQEGFLAEDDAGATDAYERENDDEEEIRRMDEEAAARRAAEASAAAAAAGSSGPGASSGAASSSNKGAITHPKCAAMSRQTVLMECAQRNPQSTILQFVKLRLCVTPMTLPCLVCHFYASSG